MITPYIPSTEQAERLPLRFATSGSGLRQRRPLRRRYSPERSWRSITGSGADTTSRGRRLENFIGHALDADHDLIIEGWQILPSKLRAAIDSCADVKVVFLVKTDERAIVSGLKSHRGKNDWVIKNTRAEGTFGAIASMIGSFGAVTARDASAYGFRAINTDVAFDATLAEAADFL